MVLVRERRRFPHSPARRLFPQKERSPDQAQRRSGPHPPGSGFLRDTPPRLRQCRHRVAGRGRFPTISTGPPDRAGERTGLVEPRRDHQAGRRAARSSARPPATSRDGDSGWRRIARSRCGRPARTGTELAERRSQVCLDLRIRRPVLDDVPEAFVLVRCSNAARRGGMSPGPR